VVAKASCPGRLERSFHGNAFWTPAEGFRIEDLNARDCVEAFPLLFIV
jgi:hypothetical protein